MALPNTLVPPSHVLVKNSHMYTLSVVSSAKINEHKIPILGDQELYLQRTNPYIYEERRKNSEAVKIYTLSL